MARSVSVGNPVFIQDRNSYRIFEREEEDEKSVGNLPHVVGRVKDTARFIEEENISNHTLNGPGVSSEPLMYNINQIEGYGPQFYPNFQKKKYEPEDHLKDIKPDYEEKKVQNIDLSSMRESSYHPEGTFRTEQSMIVSDERFYNWNDKTKEIMDKIKENQLKDEKEKDNIGDTIKSKVFGKESTDDFIKRMLAYRNGDTISSNSGFKDEVTTESQINNKYNEALKPMAQSLQQVQNSSFTIDQIKKLYLSSAEFSVDSIKGTKIIDLNNLDKIIQERQNLYSKYSQNQTPRPMINLEKRDTVISNGSVEISLSRYSEMNEGQENVYESVSGQDVESSRSTDRIQNHIEFEMKDTGLKQGSNVKDQEMPNLNFYGEKQSNSNTFEGQLITFNPRDRQATNITPSISNDSNQRKYMPLGLEAVQEYSNAQISSNRDQDSQRFSTFAPNIQNSMKKKEITKITTEDLSSQEDIENLEKSLNGQLFEIKYDEKTKNEYHQYPEEIAKVMYEIVQKRRNERTDLLSSFKIDSELGRQIPLVFSNSYNGKT